MTNDKTSILKKLNAYEFSYEYFRKIGMNINASIKIAQNNQKRIDEYCAIPIANRKGIKWPVINKGTIYYNPKMKDGSRRIENVSDGLRIVDRAHKICAWLPGGYYCDAWQNEIAIGMVYRLPARKGATQYVSAILDPCNDDCAIVDFSETFNDEKEAARRADSLAENYAEECQKHNAKHQAEQDIESNNDEISKLRMKVIALCGEFRELKNSNLCRQHPNLVQAIKETIGMLLEEKSKLQERNKALANDYWLAVQQ